MRDNRKATKAQIDCIQELIQETQTDMEWFAFENMTRHQAQDIIDRLRETYERERGIAPRLLSD